MADDTTTLHGSKCMSTWNFIAQQYDPTLTCNYIVGNLGMLGRHCLLDLYFVRQLFYVHLIHVLPFKTATANMCTFAKTKLYHSSCENHLKYVGFLWLCCPTTADKSSQLLQQFSWGRTIQLCYPTVEVILMKTIHLVTAIQNVQVSMETMIPPVEEIFGIVLTFPRNPSPDQRCTTNIDVTNSGDDLSCATHALCSNLIGFIFSNKWRDVSWMLSMTTWLLHYRSTEITIH
jgi:hypothetical protein